MTEQRITTEEMTRLYEKEGESLRAIGERARLSREKVRKILIAAGAELRPRLQNKCEIPREELVRLHVEERLTKTQIAERLGVCQVTVKKVMERQRVEPLRYRRSPGPRPNPKYPRLPELRVGESVEIRLPPRPEGSQSAQVRFRQMAKEAGIRVSLKTINGGSALILTRVDEEGGSK